MPDFAWVRNGTPAAVRGYEHGGAEYRRAMGFRRDYALPTTTSAAVRMLGNAIPPPFAAELCRQVREVAA